MGARLISASDLPMKRGVHRTTSDTLLGRRLMSRNYVRRAGNNAGRYVPHQGEQECARRRRQITSGQLTRSNGLGYSTVALLAVVVIGALFVECVVEAMVWALRVST